MRGVSIGAPGHTVAEVVFNTAMTGYQEILTDPSYSGQIVTLTYPHIGNTGVNAEDVEANRVYAAGLVVRDCPARVSNFRSTQSLPEYLSEQMCIRDSYSGPSVANDAESLFQLVERLAPHGAIDVAALDTGIARLFAAPDAADEEAAVEIMTMHKSKGLQLSLIHISRPRAARPGRGATCSARAHASPRRPCA